jgi:aminopeptidase N
MIGLWMTVAIAMAVDVDAPGEVMPARDVDVEHLHLDVDVEMDAGRIAGIATLTVVPIREDMRWFTLHQVGLEIDEVTIHGKAVKHRTTQDQLEVDGATCGTRCEVGIRYATTPQTGLHFRREGKNKTTWTQGEKEENRHWYPSWDYPNDRFTYSAEITADAAYEAVSNGALESVTQDGKKRRWRYALDGTLVNYLVVLAVGEYDRIAVDGPVPLEHIVQRGTAVEDAHATLDQASQSLAFFGELLGQPYPYSVYRQVLVEDFLYSGMENSSVTVLANRLLTTPGTDRNDTRGVIAHEVAHQWFGDLITCYGWRELWLNEGFATHYTARFEEHLLGVDAYAASVDGWHRSGLHGGAPMVPTNHGKVEGWRYGAGIYPRGALFLHFMRTYLGTEAYDHAIRIYVSRYKEALATTSQLQRVFEEVSGEHLGWAFDAFVYDYVFPKYKVSTQYKNGDVTVTFRTKEKHGLTLPVDIELGSEGSSVTKRIWLSPGTTVVNLPVAQAPKWVAVNANGALLAKFDVTQSPEAWAAQAQSSAYPYAQIAAARALSEVTGSDVPLESLVAVANDRTRGSKLRVHFVDAISQQGAKAHSAVLRYTKDPDWQVRVAAVRGLPKVKEETAVIGALRRLMRDDARIEVRAEALRAISKIDRVEGAKLGRTVLKRDRDLFTLPLQRAALGAVRRGESVGDIGILLRVARAPRHHWVRTDALRRAAQLAIEVEEKRARRTKEESVADVASSLLRSERIQIVQAAIGVLSTLRVAETQGPLEQLASESTDPDIARLAREAARTVMTRRAEKKPKERADEVKALEARIKELEARMTGVEWRR